MTRSRFAFDSVSDLLGAHVSTQGGVVTAFERATAIGATALALFSKNSNQWKAKHLDDADYERFRDAHCASGIVPILVHASYLINLATLNPLFLDKSIEAMVIELERAERLGAFALVLHPGAHMVAGEREGIDQIARSLDVIHARIPEGRVVTLLETAAGQGSCLGCSFEQLGAIRRLVDAPRRLGVCFDTCHVFASGYELRSRDGYHKTIDELDRHVGLENVGAFHLNDSKKDLGSRVDRHQHIGEGQIGIEAFRFLLNDARFAGIPKVLETPKTIPNESDVRNLTLLRSLIE